MMKFRITALLAGLAFLVPLAAQRSPVAHDNDSRLVYTIYLSRHGVRSPTGKASQYDRFSVAPWPVWSAQPAELTRHGYELIRLFGQYDRSYLQAQGLFAEGCTDASRIKVYADSDQRTVETAKALVKGMFPNCSVPVEAKEEGVNDPLFHLPKGSITPQQGAHAAAAIAGRVGNEPSAITEAYRTELSELDRILTTCGVAQTPHARASIFDVPVSIDPGTGDHIAAMRGPINTSATLTENILLEYTEGMPDKDVAWGCVDGAKLRSLINLHTASSDIVLRTPAVAVPQASALLRTIDRSLTQAITSHPTPGALGKPGDKALFLVGHDTNLTNIAGALNLNWLLDGRRDDTPPGSSMIFEVWRTHGQYSVRVFFTAQTLEQMRNLTEFSGDTKPSRVPVFVPGCSAADDSCTWAGFDHVLRKTIEPITVPARP